MMRISAAVSSLTVLALLALNARAQHPPGNVYVQTNDPAGNAIVAFDRAFDGTLQFQARYNTGGRGGGPLNSQGSVILSQDERFLFVTNVGDNSVSSFQLTSRGSLRLIDHQLTTGDGPISVTHDNGILYVLHAGGAFNDVRGLTVDVGGNLGNFVGSRRLLSAPKPGPAQVQFSPLGNWIVVTEKLTNNILIYDVDPMTRLLSNANVHPASGTTPFGFDFADDDLLVNAEASGGAPGAGTASSYRINSSVNLATITASLPTTETSPCWMKVTHDLNFAYTTNTPAQTLTGFSISGTGNLTLLVASGVSGTTPAGSNPVDLGITENDRYLYTCNTGNGSVTGFARQADGSLVTTGTFDTGPGGIWGMAVR